MNVSKLMEENVITCSPSTNLEEAAMLMWNHDCGSLPVVDENGCPIGIITDRDITMACALNHRPLWELTADQVNNHRTLYTCNMGDDIKSALNTMRSRKVRRLPVIDSSGQLRGIVTIDDIVACSEEQSGKTLTGLTYADTMTTLKAVCTHH